MKRRWTFDDLHESWFFAIAVALAIVAGVVGFSRGEVPTVNIPQSQRERNWIGSDGEGSCVHASLVMLLRWQGRPATAECWRREYGNGEYPESFAAKLEAAGIRWAMTAGENDVSFLEWACSTRRGCGVTVAGGSHMVLLIHLDAEYAGLIDNNRPDVILWVDRQAFVEHWKASNSWAVAVVYGPCPPLGVSQEGR